MCPLHVSSQQKGVKVTEFGNWVFENTTRTTTPVVGVEWHWWDQRGCDRHCGASLSVFLAWNPTPLHHHHTFVRVINRTDRAPDGQNTTMVVSITSLITPKKIPTWKKHAEFFLWCYLHSEVAQRVKSTSKLTVHCSSSESEMSSFGHEKVWLSNSLVMMLWWSTLSSNYAGWKSMKSKKESTERVCATHNKWASCSEWAPCSQCGAQFGGGASTMKRTTLWNHIVVTSHRKE